MSQAEFKRFLADHENDVKVNKRLERKNGVTSHIPIFIGLRDVTPGFVGL